MPADLADGWLAFQCAASKLRLAPIPEGWLHLSDEELATLIEAAAQRRGRSSGH